MRRATIDLKKEIAFLMPFQSTLSVRRATLHLLASICIARKFQSTLSVRRATVLATAFNMGKAISIHALREESDDYQNHIFLIRFLISIHALREESDNAIIQMFQYPTNFNPRSP